MFYYLLTARSLTYAQKSMRILTRYGVTAVLVRTPREISDRGCGYSVKVSEKYLYRSVEKLRENKIPPIGVFKIINDGYERVAL